MESIRVLAKPKFLLLCGVVACFALLCPALASATLYLGSAQNFAVLGASTVTNTGSTTIIGDVGLYAGPSIDGFALPPANTVVEGTGSTGLIAGPGLVSGTIYIRGPAAQQAQVDALTAYTTLAGLEYDTIYTVPTDIGGGLTLTPGVYKFDSSAGLTGALTLDFTSNPTGTFVFQIGSTLITAPGSSVTVIGGTGNNVFWQVGSSATLDTDTSFEGNIVALASIDMLDGATIMNGRALALTGAVTLHNNVINAVPIPPTVLLLGSGLIGLWASSKKRGKKA